MRLQDFKLCEQIDLFLLNLKIKILWGWMCQILGKDRWKMELKLEMLNFGIFPFVPEWCEHPPFHDSDLKDSFTLIFNELKIGKISNPILTLDT